VKRPVDRLPVAPGGFRNRAPQGITGVPARTKRARVPEADPVDDLPLSWPPGYPPHRPISASEAQSLDRRATQEFGIPSGVLMEHASLAIAALAAHLSAPRGGRPVLVLAGPGNNGGDGYGAARFLRSWGHDVEVLRAAAAPPREGDAAVQLRLAAAQGPVESVWEAPERVAAALERGPGVVVDALFGVGLARPLEGRFLAWVEALNAAPPDVLRLSVDVPSGMDADTGAELPVCVRAHVTATMAAPKPGLRARRDLAGHVVEVDIGLPAALHAPHRT
jgi:hydroxyethylthiazole kinase-like uncharacterized protein yjeF